MAIISDPTYYVEEGAVSDRTVEVPNAEWNGGCNIAASNAPGVGIADGVPDAAGTPEQFTLLDQYGSARNPQFGQVLGGTGLSGDYPSSGGQEGPGEEPIQIATVSTTGDGTVTSQGAAALPDLATGWEPIVI